MLTFRRVRFWAREDAINEDKNIIDPAVSSDPVESDVAADNVQVLRPMSRLGGISYGRLLGGVEIPRPDWDDFKQEAEPAGLAKPKADGQ